MFLTVEVVLALPRRQERVRVRLPAGATIGEAVAASGLLAGRPDIEVAGLRCGVAGSRVPPTARAHAGDRIEILRPLALDPREARRRRARR